MLKTIGFNISIPETLLLKHISQKDFQKKILSFVKETEKPLLTMFVFSLAAGLLVDFAEVVKINNSIIKNMLQIFEIRNKKSIAHTTSYDPSAEDLQLIINTIKILSEFYYNIYCKKENHEE